MGRYTTEIAYDSILVSKPKPGEHLYHVYYGVKTFKVKYIHAKWVVQVKMLDNTFWEVTNAGSLADCFTYIEEEFNNGLNINERPTDTRESDS